MNGQVAARLRLGCVGMASDWGQLAASRYVSFTSFRADGTPRPTPIWIAADGDNLYFITEAGSYKVKRIRKNPKVTLQLCDVRGNVSEGAPVVEAYARALDHDQVARVRRIVNGKYRIMGRVFEVVGGLIRGREASIGVEISRTPFAD